MNTVNSCSQTIKWSAKPTKKSGDGNGAILIAMPNGINLK